MTHKRNSDRRLRTLERWRSLELDEAQAERAVTEESVVRERAAIAALEQEIERNRESARSLMREPRPLSVDELRRIRTYDAWQAGVLGERNIELEAGEARAEQARDRVTHRFRQLSSVERLRERSARELATEQLRQEQKQIDAQALLRPGKTHQ